MTHAPAWRPAMSARRALFSAALPVLAPILAIIAAPAHAQSAPGPTVVNHATVHYGDLDLASPAGRHRLEARLEASADRVCHSNDGDRTLAAYQASRDCYKKAMAGAHTAIAAILDKTTPGKSRLADR